MHQFLYIFLISATINALNAELDKKSLIIGNSI